MFFACFKIRNIFSVKVEIALLEWSAEFFYRFPIYPPNWILCYYLPKPTIKVQQKTWRLKNGTPADIWTLSQRNFLHHMQVYFCHQRERFFLSTWMWEIGRTLHCTLKNSQIPEIGSNFLLFELSGKSHNRGILQSRYIFCNCGISDFLLRWEKPSEALQTCHFPRFHRETHGFFSNPTVPRFSWKNPR